MKKNLFLLLLIILSIGILSNSLASGISYSSETIISQDGTVINNYSPNINDANNPLLDLSNNVPNTGKMLPAHFHPSIKSYILTVADWVSRVNFTPHYTDPQAIVKINGVIVANGTKSANIEMSNDPSMVSVEVLGANKFYTQYTIFLQRRPSERRTRVSSGFITKIEYKNKAYNLSADLVKVTYQENSNLSTFVNETKAIYTHTIASDCTLYYGTMANPIRAISIEDFVHNYQSAGSNLYRIFYIEDKIVGLLPYGADY
ncbi:MAG: cadherin-like beta sandwich domain-containing protein [Christensenellaceae bacterium]|nr:cadherin-like beta sandwich domain-containing protein [Christensenellaceae bacterium]